MRHGRRAALTLSITVMAGGSLIIACTPSYESIGIMAPIILVLARLLQGLSLGGEYGTSATYLSEMASSGRRGFIQASICNARCWANGCVRRSNCSSAITKRTRYESLGWRIPFIIGAMGAVAVLWLRRTMDESEQFSNIKSQKRESAGTVRALMETSRKQY